MTSLNPSSQPNWPIGWAVRHVSETGSTNDDLFAAARAGAPHRSVLVADYQTAGKGRLDRTWEATRGANLLCSLLFRCAVEDAPRWSRVVSLAARAACASVAGVTPQLKWPNDLVVGDAKLGGLLAVASPQDGFVVVGIGVNVGWAPDGAAKLLHESTTTEQVSIPTPLRLLSAMLSEIDDRSLLFDEHLHIEHRSSLSTLGRRVRVEQRVGDVLVGHARDVDASSRLEVCDDEGVTHVIDVGDVIHLRTE